MFKRYRDQFGHEFTAARSPKEGWTELEDEPAVDRAGKPLPAKPADPSAIPKKALKPTTTARTGTSNEGA
jgi:hypothetical protein